MKQDLSFSKGEEATIIEPLPVRSPNKSLYMYSSNMYTQGASHIPFVRVYLFLPVHTGKNENIRKRNEEKNFQKLDYNCCSFIRGDREIGHIDLKGRLIDVSSSQVLQHVVKHIYNFPIVRREI